MTTKSDALRHADLLDASGFDIEATELRNLYQASTEGWRYADELEQERKRQADRIAALEAALGMAVEALEDARGELCAYSLDLSDEDYNSPPLNEAIATARQTLK